MARFVRWAALGAVAALVLAGCGSGSKEKADDGGKTPASDAPAASGLPVSLTGQKLDWRRCTGDSALDDAWQCATLKAPLDWSKPAGRTIDVALLRTRSSGSASERIGSLLFNFGGPGGSGIDTLPSFAPGYTTLRERYDLVTFDPRGVGRSEGVRCRSDKEIAAAESVDATPDTPAEERAFFQDADSFGQGCEKAAGELLSHVSTTDTARDMDLMRQVLGDRKLYYFGTSYGTELGGVYAHLFPKNAGRLVLDAVVDPTADAVGHARNQAQGFQRALDNYLKSTGQDPKAGTRKIAALLERLDANPLATSSDRELTQVLAITGIVTPLYSESSWPSLTSALKEAEDGDGSGLLALADAYNERDASGRYNTATHSQRVISCLDDKQRPTLDETRGILPEFEKISPVFGPFLAWDSTGWCHDWPVPGQYETPEVSAPGAAPILLVGNTGDPATPYEGARRMADELGEKVGVLLTWKGEGHGAYGSGSDCVDSTVDAYLIDGTVPGDGKVCS
ncbi:alpha/beta hydrolase [Streptomyces sp. 4F14]|uniref:alpha/beta hydrolase n=1 Tax=Streptomyces sp. 4F14 TaxID=3394380 RepID=UPI003A86E503